MTGYAFTSGEVLSLVCSDNAASSGAFTRQSSPCGVKRYCCLRVISSMMQWFMSRIASISIFDLGTLSLVSGAALENCSNTQLRFWSFRTLSDEESPL